MCRLLSDCPQSLLWLVVVAAALRVVVVFVRVESLKVDRDAYDAIARNLLDGEGFCSQPGKPTAFRPPLYPVLLAGCRALGGVAVVAILHVLLGTATVVLTWCLARRIGLTNNGSVLAAAFVTVDPLLLLYSTHLMTETLFSFLVTAVLWSLLRIDSPRRSAVAGMLFGLAALCRPTIWAFGILAGVVAGAIALQRRMAGESMFSGFTLRAGAVFVGVTGLVVSPWLIRNLAVFGEPIVMTTHGGYTMLLGNNPVFYSEVVAQPGQPPWKGDSLEAWKKSLERALTIESTELTEQQRSERLQAMAVDWICSSPREFLSCVWLRIRRLWSPGPENSQAVPEVIGVTVHRYYQVSFLLAVIGLARSRKDWRNLWLLLAFVVSLTLLHSVYWANARMRAPAIPVISIFAAAAFSRVDPASQRRDLPQL